VRASLDRLSGENHASLPTIALLAGEQFINQFQQQSMLARLGDSATAAGRDAAAAAGRQQLASLSGAPSLDPWANLSLPWGIWAAGYGQTGHLDGDGNTHGLSESATGAAVGADYKVNPALRGSIPHCASVLRSAMGPPRIASITVVAVATSTTRR
jgi:outer membrane autotransporter protein